MLHPWATEVIDVLLCGASSSSSSSCCETVRSELCWQQVHVKACLGGGGHSGGPCSCWCSCCVAHRNTCVPLHTQQVHVFTVVCLAGRLACVCFVNGAILNMFQKARTSDTTGTVCCISLQQLHNICITSASLYIAALLCTLECIGTPSPPPWAGPAAS